MTLREAQTSITTRLYALYDTREAANICDRVLEHITGKRKIDRLLEKDAPMPTEQIQQVQDITSQLLTHRPLQYVLGEAWFAGNTFFVNESVLIPRPETEELADWAAEVIQNAPDKVQHLLDIGTGSGCISVSLKKRFPAIYVHAIDVSEAAISVAKQNAGLLEADVIFSQLDFLVEQHWDVLPVFDMIISNPPYIKQSEQSTMRENVLKFEPPIALFVPDEDALLFYRKISAFGKTHLSRQGSLFLEINENLGGEVVILFEAEGYTCELRKDMQGKSRMVKAGLTR